MKGGEDQSVGNDTTNIQSAKEEPPSLLSQEDEAEEPIKIKMAEAQEGSLPDEGKGRKIFEATGKLSNQIIFGING